MANENRRRVDRRQGGDRQLLYRGVERRRGDRRVASAAAGLMVAGFIAAPSPAQAQIYSWRDAQGTLVLSNRQSGPNAKPFETPKARVEATNVEPAKPRRVSEYDDVIAEHAAAHGVRPDLVRGVIQQESNFNPQCALVKGRDGVDAAHAGDGGRARRAQSIQRVENIRGGIKYLRRLLTRYNNNEALALAAYNAGPGAVDRYGSQVPPYRETQDYVKRILGSRPSAAVVKAPVVVIYRTTEMINGHAVPHYSSLKPASGPVRSHEAGLTALTRGARPLSACSLRMREHSSPARASGSLHPAWT